MRWKSVIPSLALVVTLWTAFSCRSVEGAAAIPELGRETTPDDEKADTEALVKVQQALMLKFPTIKGRRGQHPKHHGCVLATIAVADGLPEELKFGIFREP